MSWIHNFFQMFKGQEEDLDEDINKSHVMELTENQQLPQKREIGKEVEARVAYQYPKGNFRFPVIPDGKRSERTAEKSHPNRPDPVVSKPKGPEPPPVSIKPIIPKKASEKPKKGSPFRPTEIPSPVFGFNRPKKIEVVEHELSDFGTYTVDDLSSSSNYGSEPAFHFEEANDQELVVEVEESFEPVITSRMEEANDPELVVELEESFEPVITSCMVEANDPKLLVEREDVIEEEPLLAAGQAVDLDVEGTNEELIQEHLHTDSIPEKSIMQPEGNRTHLPFNVMMLKQDKRKFEERSRHTAMVPPLASGNEVHLIQEEKLEPLPEERVLISTDYDPELARYHFPDFNLLKPPVSNVLDTDWLINQEEMLNQTLQNFNVGAKVVNVTQGPSVTRFEVQPEPGVKVNKITNLTDDIKLSLAAKDIRIEAPIPGKHTIGIEVPNQNSRPVLISEIVESKLFKESLSPLTAVLGLDISGKPIVTDLKKMPHGLIAGATGSGKSVCINTILVSLLYKASPDDLKLLLIDPKMVELAPYNRIPHLVSPVITDVKAATAALKWAVEEMERRYELFAHSGVRDINRFNELATEHKRYSEKLPFVVIIIDELADLMMMSPADVEEAICRIAQKARACGIHLIIATQRPSVDVITGLIKANVPTRIAFSVSSQIDSRTIIDISGAEKLLGRGDMLFLENGSSKPVRLQGTFVSDEEIDLVVAHAREQRAPDYLFEQEELLKKAQVSEEEDELFFEACEFVVDQGGASTSSLQRRFKIGYNRAARLMDLMEKQGFISGARGSKPREVLITESDLESIHEASSL